MTEQASSTANQEPSSRSTFLVQEILRRGQQEAANLLADESEQTIATVLALLPTAKAVALLPRFDAVRRDAILRAVRPDQREQWLHNQHYGKGTVGRLMEPVVATFAPTVTVREAVERLRDMVKQAFITYGYVVDERRRLTGVLVMRELLLAEPGQPIREVMIEHPFSLNATQQVTQ